MKLVVGVIVVLACLTVTHSGRAAEQAGPGPWAFIVGDWDFIERRYDSDSKLIQTNTGLAQFTLAMSGQRIQELQTVLRDGESTSAFQLFAFDRGSDAIEIARTDSDHAGFWVIAGTSSRDRMGLTEKHPDPESKVTRRITYERTDASRFRRTLEFSTDRGETWFVRSLWLYQRR